MKLLSKLLLIQSEMKAVSKDQTNPFFHSKYFNIDSVIDVLRPLLTKHGIVVLQPLAEINGAPAIMTIVAEAESGEEIRSVTPLIALNDPQKMGAVITYTRRYALTSLFLLQGEEDDDGNSASAKTEAKYEPMPLDTINQMAPKIHSDQADALCPSCGVGFLREKKGKFGAFVACSNYPQCRHTVK